MDTYIKQIFSILSSHEISGFSSNEHTTYSQIENILINEGFKVEKEYQLGNGSRIDFFLPKSGVGIEVKVNNTSRFSILRQIQRYMEYDEIRKLILISVKNIALPEKVNEKNLYCFPLSYNSFF